MNQPAQTMWENLRLQLVYYKKQSMILGVLLLFWMILLGRYFIGRGSQSSIAAENMTDSGPVNGAAGIGTASQPPTEVERPVIFFSLADVHMEIKRDPFAIPWPMDRVPDWPAGSQSSGSNPDRSQFPSTQLFKIDGINKKKFPEKSGVFIEHHYYEEGDFIQDYELIRVLSDRVLLKGAEGKEIEVLWFRKAEEQPAEPMD